MQEVTKRLIDELKKKVEKERFVDVSKGTAKYFMVSDERLRTAIIKMQEEDYNITYIKMNNFPKCVVKILSKEEFSKDMTEFARKSFEARKM